MQKWGNMMSGLQENMAKLLTKVSDMQTNIDNSKQNTSPQQESTNLHSEKTERHKAGQNTRRDSVESLQTNDSFEALRLKITNYLENVINQNQVIIEENQKLRQNIGKKINECIG